MSTLCNYDVTLGVYLTYLGIVVLNVPEVPNRNVKQYKTIKAPNIPIKMRMYGNYCMLHTQGQQPVQNIQF